MIYKELETDEKYLVSFKRSVGYLKLLAELDLLKVNLGITSFGRKLPSYGNFRNGWGEGLTHIRSYGNSVLFFSMDVI